MLKDVFKKIIVSILTLQAKLVLKKYKPKIIAVTGSVGKTSAKDAIYAALRPSFFVRKSEKSFNSELGVPLSILGCNNGKNSPILWLKNIFEGFLLIVSKNHYPKWLVLEVGADKSGDIENIAKWLKPDIAVITRFAEIPAHIEYFDSPKDVIREKKKLAQYLKQDGFLILNYDDKEVFNLKEEFQKKTVSYGLDEGADIIGSNNNLLYEDGKIAGVSFKVNYDGSSVPIKIKGVLGIQHVYPALSAIAVGVSLGLNLVDISQSLSGRDYSQPGRMRIIDGVKGSTIIDDSYNASPIAVEWALRTLKNIETDSKKIAILGDMMELGKYATEAHKKVGQQVAGVCDVLVTVGVRSVNIAQGALNAGMKESNILQFENSRKAGAYVQNIIEKGDIILVKGSRWATRMEFAVEEIMANPERADELLVR